MTPSLPFRPGGFGKPLWQLVKYYTSYRRARKEKFSGSPARPGEPRRSVQILWECCRADTPSCILGEGVEKPIDSRSARPPCRPGVDSVSRRLARRTYIARRGRRCAAEWNGELFELSALLANVHGGLLCR